MGILGVNYIAFRTPDPAALKACYRRIEITYDDRGLRWRED